MVVFRFLVLWEGYFAGFAVAKKDSRVWRNDDLLLKCFQVLLPWLSLPSCDEAVAFLPLGTLPEIYGEADCPNDEH